MDPLPRPSARGKPWAGQVLHQRVVQLQQYLEHPLPEDEGGGRSWRAANTGFFLSPGGGVRAGPTQRGRGSILEGGGLAGDLKKMG